MVVLAGCGDAVEEQVEVPRPVRAVPVFPSAAIAGGDLPGRAEATNEVNLAFEVSGVITEIPVEKGDRVKAGDVLAKLAPRDYQNSLNSAEAERERAKAQFDRVFEASKTGAVSEQEVTNARASLDIAIADFDLAKKALEDTVLVAPFDGVIATLFADEFQRIRATETVIRLLDDSQIEFTVQLPERFLPYLSSIKRFTVTFDIFGDMPLPALIDSVGSEASEATRTYPLTLILDQPDGLQILPGMSGQANAELAFEENGNIPAGLPVPGVRIPPSALVERDGSSAVWVLDKESSTVSLEEVQTVGVSGDGVYLQFQELDGVDWIVTAGTQFLKEGQSVRLLNEE